MLLLEETFNLASYYHKGQFDKSGSPYIDHPFSVMLRVARDYLWCTEEYLHIALLHDVLEDTNCTEQELINYGYSEYIIRGLFLLNKHNFPKYTYLEWIRYIAETEHLGAITVKLADNLDNSDFNRINKLPEIEKQKFTEMANNRYKKSIAILESKLRELKIISFDI